MDISHTIAPDSDQLDAVDLMSGPRIFTIKAVSKGDAEQPVNIHLAEFDRPWRPGKSMRRVLVFCWGPDAGTYVGRRVQLYCDAAVSFGGIQVGGTRIKALSHLDKPRRVPLLVSRGKSQLFEVLPLSDAPAPASVAERAAAAVKAFAAGGVTADQLAARVGKPAVDWTAADLDALTELYAALKSGATTKVEAFPDPGENDTGEPLDDDGCADEMDGAEAAAEGQ